jgi:hypothetical protein
MKDPIKELAVQSLNQPGPQPAPGFEYNPLDLNKGLGGNFIYIGWQRGAVNDNPVTQIDFEAFGEIQNVNPRGDWEWNPLDLKAGAGGKFIYVFWKRGGATPVYNIALIVTPSNTPPPIAGYTPIYVDLNAGAGGPYIWAYYTTKPDNT